MKASPHPMEENLYSRRFCLLLVAVSACIICLLPLPFRILDSGDATRVAGISAEMEWSGDWVTPRLNGTPFLEFPPAFYWMQAASFHCFGIGESAAGLPNAVFCFLSLLLLYFAAREWKLDPPGALLASLILGTSLQFFSSISEDTADAMLSFFILLSWYAAYGMTVRVLAEERILFFLLTVCGLTGGLLTKGLVGAGIPLVSIGTWLLLEDIRERKLRIRRFLLLALALLTAAVPLLFWTVLLYRKEGAEAVYTVWWINGFGRFSGSQGDHLTPWYYYILKIHSLFQPWLIFLFFAFGAAAVRIRRKTGDASRLLAVCCAILVPFLLLSLSSSKRQVYLLPLYPYCALLTAWCIRDVLPPALRSRKEYRTVSRISVRILGWIWAAAVVLLLFFRPAAPVILFSLAALVSVLVLLLHPPRSLRKRTVLAVLCVAFGYAAIDSCLLVKQKTADSLLSLFQTCRALENEGYRIVLVNPPERTQGAACFYLRKTLPVRNENMHISGTALLYMPEDPKECWLIRSRTRFSAPNIRSFPDDHYLIFHRGKAP